MGCISNLGLEKNVNLKNIIMQRPFEISVNIFNLASVLKDKIVTISVNVTECYDNIWFFSENVTVEIDKIRNLVIVKLSENDNGSYLFDLDEGSMKCFYNSQISEEAIEFILTNAEIQLSVKNKLLNGPQIYKITNKKNGKIYIGKSIHKASLRWLSHLKGYGSKEIYKEVINEGIQNFICEVIEVVDVPNDVICKIAINKLVLAREKYYIEFYDSINNGYNEQ